MGEFGGEAGAKLVNLVRLLNGGAGMLFGGLRVGFPTRCGWDGRAWLRGFWGIVAKVTTAF